MLFNNQFSVAEVSFIVSMFLTVLETYLYFKDMQELTNVGEINWYMW